MGSVSLERKVLCHLFLESLFANARLIQMMRESLVLRSSYIFVDLNFHFKAYIRAISVDF